MSRYLDLRRDDEVFSARLQEVNREMDTLLHKTSRTRHDIDRTAAEVRMGVPLHFYDRGEGRATHNSHPPLLASTATRGESGTEGGGALQDDVTRAVVSAELRQWVHAHMPQLVAPLVESQVQHHLQHLRTSVEEVHARQAEVEASVRDSTEQLRVHRRDMQAGLSAIQRGVRQDMENHQRRLDGELSTWREEVQRAKDEVRALQAQTRGEPERIDRRLHEALQHHQQHTQETFAHLNNELQRWRQCVQRDIEKDAHALQRQQSELEAHVAQLQGMLASTANMTTHCTAELQQVVEDAVVRASDMRRCRGDLNRLEMLVECVAAYTTASTRRKAAAGGAAAGERQKSGSLFGGTNWESDTPSLHSMLTLTHDVSHLNDKLLAVVSRVDSIDRQLREMDLALVRGAAPAAVGHRGPRHDTLREFPDDSVYSRSGASTRQPSNSQLSSIFTARSSGAVGCAFASSPTFSAPQDGVSFAHRGELHNASDSGGGTAAIAGQPQHQQQQQPHSPYSPSATPSASILTGGIGNSSTTTTPPRHGEKVPMRAGPSPSELHRPPLSHLGSSRVLADDPEDLPRMPVVAVGNAVRGGSGGTSPSQRRAPPRVIPVESAPLSSGVKGENGSALRGGASANARSSDVASGVVAARPSTSSGQGEKHTSSSSSKSRTASEASTHSSAEMKRATTTSQQGASPFAFSLDRHGGLHLPSTTSVGDQRSPVIGTAEPVAAAAVSASASPADSYVSDGPPVAASAEDSYVSSSPMGSDGAAPQSQDRFGRYTPAPASDSEEERDNHAISRSALD